MFDYNLYPIYFLFSDNTLFRLTDSLLLTSSNDAFVDIVDDECSFELSPKTEFTSAFYVATGTEKA